MEAKVNKSTMFIAACGGMLLFGITLITLGSVTTDITNRFNLNPKSIGTIFSILPIGILLGSFIFGPIADKRGYKLILAIAAFLMFIGFEGIAFTYNIKLLYLSVFLFGIGGGIINTGTNALVSEITNTNKGANLAILGVFFGIGAIGMPLLIGLFNSITTSFNIVAGVGLLTLIVFTFYLFISFPKTKNNSQNINNNNWKRLFSPLLFFASMVLFFQSSLEAIINNWTTTFLIDQHGLIIEDALYALSLHMGGMIFMRVLLGTLLRNWSIKNIMWTSLGLILFGVFTMQILESKLGLFFSLILSGAGLAAGFPAILGLIGEKYSSISGKAFSFAFTIALIGNILVNYLMGIFIQRFGVPSLIYVCYIEIAFMAIFFVLTMRATEKFNYIEN